MISNKGNELFGLFLLPYMSFKFEFPSYGIRELRLPFTITLTDYHFSPHNKQGPKF